MIKKITLWVVAVMVIFGLSLWLDGGLVKEIVKIKNVKQLSTMKPIVEEENGQSKVFGNIIFKYNNNKNSLNAIDAALDSLNENEKLFNDLFGKENSEPISIVLINDSSKLQNLFGPNEDGYFGGYYVYERKSIYMAVPKDEIETIQYKQTIAHEYTHHLITTSLDNAGLVVSDLPVWFHEGLAAYVERKDFGISSEEIENKEYVSFKELETHKQWNSHLRSPYNPYLQSRVLVGLLIENEGVTVIHRLIEGCKESNFSDAFKRTIGISLPLYESETLKTLKEFPSQIDSGRGKLYQDKNPEAALETAIELNDNVPNVREVIILLSKIYLEIGDYEKSIYYHEKIVKLFPSSSYYNQLANVLIYKDLDKSIEASKLSVKIAEKEEVHFYQEHLDRLNNLKESIENGNPLKGYIYFLSNEPFFTDKYKVDLLTIILERYPNVSEGREDVISLKQSLQ